jgi:hypothetical protein
MKYLCGDQRARAGAMELTATVNGTGTKTK